MKGMIFLGLSSKLLCYIVCGTMCLSSAVIYSEAVKQVNYSEAKYIEAEVTELESEAIFEEEIISTEEEIVEEEFIFTKPVSEGVITSLYGMRRGKLHTGIDIANKLNTEIYASQSGEVIFAGYSGNYGNLVKIKHKDGYESYYAHCNKILVKKGDIVEQGQHIAKMGMTGNATGPHLHFEIRLNGETLNPYEFIYGS